ncbi:MAG: glycosyltransferase family 4 protein [Deltaproteobacteria bacterium]
MKKKHPTKKIAIVIPTYSLVGGAEAFAVNLTEEMAKESNYEFHVIANKIQRESKGIIFHHVPIIKIPRFLTTPSFAYFTQRIIKKHQFDIVHSHERIFDADIFTTHGIPHRYWIENIRKKRMFSLHDRTISFVEKRIMNSPNCHYYAPVSNLTKKIMLSEYCLEDKSIQVICPGVDRKFFATQNKNETRRLVRNHFGFNQNDVVFLFVSMNFEIKGLDSIIQAISQLKNTSVFSKIKLLIVGKGNQRKYEKMATELGVCENLVFTGILPQEKLIQTYFASDAFIMLSFFDTFGMVVLEAMASGLPAIISGNVGAKDVIVEGENGFVIDFPLTTASIVEKLNILCEQEKLKEMGESAIKTAHNHSWGKTSKQVLDIYQEILKK